MPCLVHEGCQPGAVTQPCRAPSTTLAIILPQNIKTRLVPEKSRILDVCSIAEKTVSAGGRCYCALRPRYEHSNKTQGGMPVPLLGPPAYRFYLDMTCFSTMGRGCENKEIWDCCSTILRAFCQWQALSLYPLGNMRRERQCS